MGKHWAPTILMRESIRLIGDALSEYRAMPYDPDRLPSEVEFTPTQLMYRHYLGWLPRHELAAVPVDERVFGRSLCLAIGADRCFRVRRTYKGVMQWGYLGIKGPGSILIPNKRGRRRGSKDVHKAPAPAAEVPGGAEADRD